MVTLCIVDLDVICYNILNAAYTTMHQTIIIQLYIKDPIFCIMRRIISGIIGLFC